MVFCEANSKMCISQQKPKHRIRETIKWGLICIMAYASLDEIFICPQSAKNLCCKQTHCLLKKKINFLQEIHKDLLSKSAIKQETASIFFSSKRKHKTILPLLLPLCCKKFVSEWLESNLLQQMKTAWLDILPWIQLDFFVGLGIFFVFLFQYFPSLGIKRVFLLNF